MQKRDTHHHGNLKSELMALALQAARAGTIEDMSLRKAARDLGVSPGAIYRHFADKDALLRAVAQIGFDELATAFETIAPFDTPVATAQQARKRFLGLAEEYVRFSMTHYGLWRLMFGPHGVGTSTDPIGRPSTYAWLQRALDELHHTGVLPAPAGPADQFFAWSAIHGLADLQASPVIRTAPLTESVEKQVTLILRAIGASLP